MAVELEMFHGTGVGARAEARCELVARIVDALAAFTTTPICIAVGAADDGCPQVEITGGCRWLVVRPLYPGDRWWVNGQRDTPKVMVDVMLREGTLEIVWPALLWVLGMGKA